jgi:hypothetical protein
MHNMNTCKLNDSINWLVGGSVEGDKFKDDQQQLPVLSKSDTLQAHVIDFAH